jgi:hypothetical protein
MVVFVTDDVVWIPYIDILKDLYGVDMTITHFLTLQFNYQIIRELDQDTSYLFFVNREDTTTANLIRLERELEGPYFSPYNVPDDKEFAMYSAPAHHQSP